MYSVSPELYHEAAARLSDAIDGGNYFSGSLAFRFGDTDCRLTASVIVYRGRLSLPEGGAAPRYGSRARLVGIPHHASRGAKCSTTSTSPS
ncbi:hypothetical protein [Alistipes sp.]|uniref:hypothetical protein n=1 Tax=Alistipes sp. TaxID=1872444 RepID=UPI0039931BE6